jgi:hypothetical protein
MSRRAPLRLPHLRRFFATYLHEDFAAEGEGFEAAARRFAAATTSARRAATVRELERLLASTRSERVLDVTLARLRCAYDPAAAGTTARAFLERLAEVLRAG